MKLPVSVALAAAAGTCSGFLVFAGVRAGATRYLSDDPSACTGCHAMREHHDSWSRSGHRRVASCDDCHAAPSGASRVLDLGTSGLRHATAYVLDGAGAPIRANGRTGRVAEAACRRCHARVAGAMLGSGGRGGISCVACHGSVGHISLREVGP